MEGLKRLSVIQKLSKEKGPTWVHKDLFRILRKDDIWVAAYENIKGNKGALTPGITSGTLDGTSMAKLQKLRDSVLDESYKFKPVKQIFIPKADGRRRPLGLPTPNDKLVQEVLRMVLEAVYEPNFDEKSFGFRSGKGVHDALEHVEKEFRWVDWVIKGDIKDAYPTINHNILCEILEQRISDPRFMRLIRKSLKCGTYVNPETLYSKLGVPQGSIVSPILANIYFDQLDNWVALKKEEVYQEKSSKRHPEYKRLEHQIRKLSQELNQTKRDSKQYDLLVRNLKQLIQQRIKTPSLLDPGLDIRYARYADDWIIGIRGPRDLSIQIREEVGEFMLNKLEQELDPIKTKVINIRADRKSVV